MAQSKFIQSVVKAAKGRPRSTEWFRDKIKEFGKPGAMDLIRDGKRDNAPFYGRLNMFFYDPKFKKTLPYYDTFPLVLPLEKYTDGFLGINFGKSFETHNFFAFSSKFIKLFSWSCIILAENATASSGETEPSVVTTNDSLS